MKKSNVQYCVNTILNNNLALFEDYTLLLVVTSALRNPFSSLLSPSGKLAWGLKSALLQTETCN